jgi:hypothetical protein
MEAAVALTTVPGAATVCWTRHAAHRIGLQTDLRHGSAVLAREVVNVGAEGSL